MEKINRRYIDWEKTGMNLRELRERNDPLIRYACFICHYNEGNCDGECERCRYSKGLDPQITRKELARVFNTTETVILNWERGTTPVPLDDIFYYCQIAKMTLDEILVYTE